MEIQTEIESTGKGKIVLITLKDTLRVFLNLFLGR